MIDRAIGKGHFRITGEVLAAMLHLPEGVTVEAIMPAPDYPGDFRLRVAGPGLPFVEPGHAIPRVEPTYRRVSDTDGETIEFVSWGSR